ncbi:transcriptional factor B3 [Rhizophagus clarus]|uniref:ATP-dependent DNA helicase n=1 Tax=Rhizophagus clarus TaxID=94130 RepID=A0A8H3QQD3_9GLOM|nr:transcriptional factor B3 [Rhizophagus clarus]
MVGDGHELHTANRDILLKMRNGNLQRISEIHPSYDPLHYILLFPRGDDGWHVDIPLIGSVNRERQYIVDQYTKIEQNRLNYLKHNQATLRTDLYNGVMDAIHANNNTNIGRRIILPSSFAGSPRQMYQLYQDAMAIVSRFGKPDLFVTFTCNPKWSEITRELLPHQSAVDWPDLTARIFHMKLQELLKDLLHNHCLGKVNAYIYVIEFQKRGLPHAHFLLILASESKLRSTKDYDSIVSAEIPNPVSHSLAYETVSTMMLHGPCGVLNPTAPCMKDGICQKHYPKNCCNETQEDNNGYPIYRRRDSGHIINIKDVFLDNRWVVPHNVNLITKYNAHINVEICSSILSIKYLYKYVYKGHDRATITLFQSDHNNIQQTLEQTELIDEIKIYLDARYVSASESIWRIFHYRMHGRASKVQKLAVHLPDHQSVTFQEGENLQNIIERAISHKTILTAFFQENMKNPAARAYTYIEFPIHYTWDLSLHKWKPRKTTTTMIGRLYMVQPSEGERYYLRTLLIHVKGPTSFNDLKTVNGYTCKTFKEACICLSLLQDDNEWDECLLEVSAIQSGKQLCHLFASILLFCQPVNPEILWNKHKLALCEDICYQHRVILQLKNDDITDNIEHKAFYQLDDYLLLNGKSLKDFPDMPIPPSRPLNIDNNGEDLDQLIREERSYNIPQLQEEVCLNVPLLNDDQRAIYDAVLQAIADANGCFFVDGPGGTGKTFLYNTLLATVSSSGEIAVAVASSGIAALLMKGGRTAHSQFKIPLKLNESSTCSISRNSKEA